MIAGDVVALLVNLVFVFMAIASIYYLKKYESNKMLELKSFGSSILDIKKCYYATFILGPIGLSAFSYSGKAFDVKNCTVSKCIEAHNISWWLFGSVLVISCIIINRVAKRMLDIEKSRRPTICG